MIERSSEGHKQRLVVASSNQGKIAELIDLLGDRFEVEPRPTDLAETVEDGETLEANAQKKATEVTAHTGTTALADDTGLFVSALGGRPGVHTARYASVHTARYASVNTAGVHAERAADDQANIDKLLGELAQADDRSAEFRTVIAVTGSDGSCTLATGVVKGRIAEAMTGERGFGYDPVFVPDEGDGRTFAQMSRAEKGLISHRGRALRALLDQL